jgi:hypothetical protein
MRVKILLLVVLFSSEWLPAPSLKPAASCLSSLFSARILNYNSSHEQTFPINLQNSTTPDGPFENFPIEKHLVSVGKDYFASFDKLDTSIFFCKWKSQSKADVKEFILPEGTGKILAVSGNKDDIFFVVTTEGLYMAWNTDGSWKFPDLPPSTDFIQELDGEDVVGMQARTRADGTTALALLSNSYLLLVYVSRDLTRFECSKGAKHSRGKMLNDPPAFTILPRHREENGAIVEESMVVVGFGDDTLLISQFEGKEVKSFFHPFIPLKSPFAAIIGQERLDAEGRSRGHLIAAGAGNTVTYSLLKPNMAPTIIGLPAKTALPIVSFLYSNGSYDRLADELPGTGAAAFVFDILHPHGWGTWELRGDVPNPFRSGAFIRGFPRFYPRIN